MKQIPVVTIDGPSGVGKGTLSQALAKTLAWHLLDSGAIYRVFALSIFQQEKEIASFSPVLLQQYAEQLNIAFIPTDAGRVDILLNDENVTDMIRSEHIGMLASKLAVIPEVRQGLLARQRSFARQPGLIADGRDMGTIVFPHAVAKIFLDASAEERANRRMKQLQFSGNSVKFSDVLSEILQRDDRDRNRAVAPLKAAPDALVIDSTSMSIDEVIKCALAFINDKFSI